MSNSFSRILGTANTRTVKFFWKFYKNQLTGISLIGILPPLESEGGNTLVFKPAELQSGKVQVEVTYNSHLQDEVDKA